MILNEDLFEDVIEADVDDDFIDSDIIFDDTKEDIPQVSVEVSSEEDITTRIRDQITTELSLNNVYTELKQFVLNSDMEHSDKYVEVFDSIIADHAFIVGKLQGLMSGTSPEEVDKIESTADDTKEQISPDIKDLLKQQEEMPDAMDVTDDDVSFMSDDFTVSDGIIPDDD